MGPGIHGSKPIQVRGCSPRTRAVYIAINPWQPCHNYYTVNREYFDVKIFSDSMACAKIKRAKYMRNINDNAVQGRLSENYLTRKIIA